MSENGYWCVVCCRFLEADGYGVIVHDLVPHPIDMNFNEAIDAAKREPVRCPYCDDTGDLTHAVQTLRDALTEVLATYRSTCRPPDTIEKAEEHLQRIRAASELGNKALASTAGVVKT